MTGADVYRWLMSGPASPVCEQFDVHVVACALSVAIDEARQGQSVCEALGLTPDELAELSSQFFPHASSAYGELDPASSPTFADEELRLQHLLADGSTERSRLQKLLACIVARRAQRPNPLWQELGLRNRRELSWLMDRHFEPVAQRNQDDSKWKEYLLRRIGCA